MDDDKEGILSIIRPLIISNKGPTPIRNLSRDYETIEGSPIPFRQFNYSSLEDFLRSLPSLMVHGSGAYATVEAATSSASQHISALIARQKSTAKKSATYPPKRGGYSSSFRGRGGRGRGRGSYPSRPYASRDYSTRDQPRRDYPSRDYTDRDEPARDYPAYTRDYPKRDYSAGDRPSRDQSSRDYPAGDRPSRDQSSRDYPARDQPSPDYPSRDYSAGDRPSRDQSSRDYPARDQPSPDYPSRDYSAGDQPTRDYNHTNSAPKRYSPNLQNRYNNAQAGGPFTIKVDGDDKRQVSWKKNELPPRLQKLKQQNTDTPPAPSVSPVSSQSFDSSLFMDQSSAASSSGPIISPLGPSQLIAAGRAKQEAEKAQFEQQLFGTPSDFLLQPTSQGTNDLAANFARLSHQDSFNGVDTARNHTSFNGQNQIPEDPSALPLLQPEDLLPIPDEKNFQNNMAILLRYCLSRGWPVPTYSAHHHKCPDSHKILYFAAVKVNGDGANNFKISTIPFEHENVNVVKGFAAKKALAKILDEESKVKADKTISSDPNIICNRISDIVAAVSTGMFARSVEDEYFTRHNELLPKDWIQTVSSWPTIAVESTVNNTIIVPRAAAPKVPFDPTPQPVQFDPTCPPPPLPIEALGDDEGCEDVYVTHATSVSNVWFRVIGKDYSDEYDVLLNNMDIYYNGVGAQELALMVEVGQYYAARDLNTWFRVCVVEVDEASKTALAWLVDHGDNESFPFNSLYRLAPQFCQLPRQAVHCALEDLESFSDDEIASEVVSTSELLIGQTLIAKISFKDTEAGFVKATLYDTSGDDDVVVNERIKDEIIAKAEPVLPAEGSATTVAIGDVSKKGEVYIIFASPSQDRISEILESLGPDKISEHKLTSFKHISQNKMYLAKYSKDDTWYRAVVIAAPSVQHNKIPVRFVDYGNTESVSISDIADLENLPSILKKLPAQAVKVALHMLPLETLTNPEVARLHSLLLDDEDKVVLIKTVSLKADPPIVEIYTKDSENAALVSVNSTIELQRKLYSNEDKKTPLNSATSDANASQFNNNQDGFVLKCPAFSVGEFQAVLVVLAAHPGNFIFQPTKYGKDLKKLRQQMKAYYEAGEAILPEVPVERVLKNKLFAARYVGDVWYRVVVTDSLMGSRVPVRLCDYGDVTCVNISCLRELAPDFHNYPFMAVKGKLAGVMPVHKDWSVEDCIRFQTLVVDQILASIVVEINENNENPMEMVVTLNLVDTSKGEDQDIKIAEVLVQEQRAVKEG